MPDADRKLTHAIACLMWSGLQSFEVDLSDMDTVLLQLHYLRKIGALTDRHLFWQDIEYRDHASLGLFNLTTPLQELYPTAMPLQ